MRSPIAMPALSGRVSRRDIALSPAVWTVVWGTFAMFAFATMLIAMLSPEGLDRDRIFLLSTSLAVIALGMSRMSAPEPDRPRTHALLALTYLGPMVAMLAFGPQGSAVALTAAFAGPLTSVWIVDRRQIAAHQLVATVAMFAPSALGLVDEATLVTCMIVAPTMWTLTATCVVVLEAAERQGAELTRLSRRDPLTGAGNRRLLEEALDAALARHAARREGFALLTFDLNGFKALNDTVGHAAGDHLLRATAEVLLHAARPGDTVVRQGGDEFCIVMPRATPADAAVLGELIRARLQAVQAYGAGISTGLGHAACPEDGTNADRLLTVADERLLADKAASGSAHRASWQQDVPETQRRPSATAAGDAHSAHHTLDGVSRRHLAGMRATWWMAAGTAALYALIGAALLLWAPQLTRDGLEWVVGITVIGLTAFLFAPPELGTLRNHAYVLMPCVVPAAYAATMRPGAIALGVSMFVGPLAAVRLTERRHVVWHLAAASSIFLALLILRAGELPTVVSLIVVIANLWVLGFSCLLILEASERQGALLARAVRHDPLTELGNRRRLRERLQEELDAHAKSGHELTVITLDLNGFKHLNDTAGHAAGDAVLRRVAAALRVIAAPPAEAMRQGGDEFAIVLPDTTANEARATAAAISRSLGTITEQGVPVTTGVGAATFPADGTSVDALLDQADHRLRAHKYGGPDTERSVHQPSRQPDDRTANRLRPDPVRPIPRP